MTTLWLQKAESIAMPNRKQSPTDIEPRTDRSALGRWIVWGGIAALFIVCGGLVFADWWICLPVGTQATYVGRQSCIACHMQQTEQWTGSYHDLAMDVASETSVLGDFNNVELSHHGLTSRMYRQDGKFMVHTEGPDGAMADFEVKYVFGVDPLQQYMVEFDRPEGMPVNEIARLQVLRISWDTERRQWFYLSPPDVDESVERLSPDDDLHWTGIAQRWNNMCAECHSTNLQKRFNAQTRIYHTTFSEIDVSCEACHGPGSIHVQLAYSKSLFWDRRLGYGLVRLKDKNPEIEIQACAQCHSRRRVIQPSYRPGENYYDYFANELLHGATYHADGQILDEVYVYGSFIQSKMYHKGIRCTDCHNPHTTRLKDEGNRVCTSCHAHPASKYDTVTHHQHKEGSPGAACVECHMPETTYMDVDPRRDHSLRIPRPDLSVELGTPNACTQCHVDQNRISSDKRAKLKQYADWLRAARDGDWEIKNELDRLDQWASRWVQQWFGREHLSETHFAYALDLAHQGNPDAEDPLLEVARNKQVPAIVRATALFELGGAESRGTLQQAREALKDANPQLRGAALGRIETEIARQRAQAGGAPPEITARFFRPLVEDLTALLSDEVRFVRTEAARVLAGVPPQVLAHLLSGPQRQTLRDAIDELKGGLMVNNDRAGAHLTLAILYENLGEWDEAVEAYETALHVEPRVTGPRSNLAALLERFAEEADTQSQRAALTGTLPPDRQAATRAADFRQRAKTLRRQELDLLARDARLAPQSAPIQYRYGLLLYLHDQIELAETHLQKACELSPRTADYVLALALLYRKQARWKEAVDYAGRLVELHPDAPAYQQLLAEIMNDVKKSSASAEPYE